jgi:hypothetical protein
MKQLWMVGRSCSRMMMKRCACWFILVAFAFLSCDNENEDALPNRVVFELEVLPNVFSETEEHYIIATAPDGTYLGMTAFRNGQTVMIDSAIASLPDKINITRVVFSPATNSNLTNSYYVDTHTDVPVGSKWFYKRPGSAYGLVGSATINVANFPSGAFYSISSINGYFGGSIQGNSSNASLHANLAANPSELFIGTVGTLQDPRYYRTDAISAGSTLNLDFQTDFHAYDNTVIIPADNNFTIASIRGFNRPIAEVDDPNFGSHEFGLYTATNANGIRLGFNGGYESYLTLWAYSTPDGSALYEKSGVAPVQTDFTPIHRHGIVQSTDMNNFEYSTTGAFHYLSSYYSSQDAESRLSWSVQRPVGSTNKIITDLPERIKTIYPALSTLYNQLTHGGTIFVWTTTEKASDLYVAEKSAAERILEGESWSVGN